MYIITKIQVKLPGQKAVHLDAKDFKFCVSEITDNVNKYKEAVRACYAEEPEYIWLTYDTIEQTNS